MGDDEGEGERARKSLAHHSNGGVALVVAVTLFLTPRLILEVVEEMLRLFTHPSESRGAQGAGARGRDERALRGEGGEEAVLGETKRATSALLAPCNRLCLLLDEIIVRLDLRDCDLVLVEARAVVLRQSRRCEEDIVVSNRYEAEQRRGPAHAPTCFAWMTSESHQARCSSVKRAFSCWRTR